MFCQNCGAHIDGGNFCANCGAAIAKQEAPVLNTVSDPSLPEGIYRDENGAYHWTYRMNMLKNPTVPIMFLKALGCIMAGVALFMSLCHLFNGLPRYIPDTLLMLLAVTVGLSLLFMIVWLIMAKARGGWYVVEHMMDENRVVYLSTPEEQRKMHGWTLASFILAIAGDNMTVAANSVALAGAERFDSEYTDVREIQAVKHRDLIKVNNILQRNTIYAAPHQYDFVYKYIVSHCPDAKVR